MIKTCIVDGTPFEATKATAKYCSPRCNKRAQRGSFGEVRAVPRSKKGRTAATSIATGDTSPDQGGDSSDSGLVRATRKQLENAGVVIEESMLGQQALRIATQMSGRETAGGMASLSKELSRVMAEAMRSAATAMVDQVDELKAKREAKWAAAG